MTRKLSAGLAVLAAIGLASAGPASAAATRSAQALPVVAASVGAVPYQSGVESTWGCVQVDDSGLNIDKEYVRVDKAGRVVVDSQGSPYRCRAPASSYNARGNRFPFEIALGILGLGALVIAVAGSGGNDSPG